MEKSENESDRWTYLFDGTEERAEKICKWVKENKGIASVLPMSKGMATLLVSNQVVPFGEVVYLYGKPARVHVTGRRN